MRGLTSRATFTQGNLDILGGKVIPKQIQDTHKLRIFPLSEWTTCLFGVYNGLDHAVVDIPQFFRRQELLDIGRARITEFLGATVILKRFHGNTSRYHVLAIGHQSPCFLPLLIVITATAFFIDVVFLFKRCFFYLIRSNCHCISRIVNER